MSDQRRAEAIRDGVIPWPSPAATVHPSVVVPSSTIIYPGAYVGAGVRIGLDVVIGPNAVIGDPGFGFIELDDGSWEYREHPFGVVLDNGVYVGANTCINRGRHRDTRIGSGTKIDTNVHVGHNAVIGSNCLLIACCQIGGSCEIGDGVIVSPSATLRDHVTVGERAMIGLGAVVVRDVPAGQVWAGNPARYMRDRGDELR